jgi:chemotaxis protein MotB
MAHKKKTQPHAENHERWLVSYSDFITLMFAFFVVMFASSNRDKVKAQQFSESVRQALGKDHAIAKMAAVLGGTVDERGPGNAQRKGPGGARPGEAGGDPPRAEIAELLPSMEFLSRELRQEIEAGRLKLSLEPRGLVVTLPQATYFPSGQDSIDPATYPIIAKLAETIRKLPNQIRLEGHTDSLPIHNARFRSNWELSVARSLAMLDLLATRFSVPRERMAVAGYADNVPVQSNDTEAGRMQNRRVDLVIVNQMGLLKEPAPLARQPSPAGPPGGT